MSEAGTHPALRQHVRPVQQSASEPVITNGSVVHEEANGFGSVAQCAKRVSNGRHERVDAGRHHERDEHATVMIVAARVLEPVVVGAKVAPLFCKSDGAPNEVESGHNVRPDVERFVVG